MKLRAGECGTNRAGARMCVLEGRGTRFVGKDFDAEAEGFKVVGVEEEELEQEPEDELSERVAATSDGTVEQLGRNIADAINEALSPIADALDEGDEVEDDDDQDDDDAPEEDDAGGPEPVTFGAGFQS